MDEAPEKSTISITWFVVTDLLVGSESPQSTYPDVVSRVGWINDAGAAWE